jgi:hypothetical protein
VQTRHNQYVKYSRLLKIRRFGLIHKTPVTEKHCSQHAGNLRSARKELINLFAQSPPCSRENRSDGWRGDPND